MTGLTSFWGSQILFAVLLRQAPTAPSPALATPRSSRHHSLHHNVTLRYELDDELTTTKILHILQQQQQQLSVRFSCKVNVFSDTVL